MTVIYENPDGTWWYETYRDGEYVTGDGFNSEDEVLAYIG